MRTVRVIKSRWLRGVKESALLNKGKMCCIGFVARELGARTREIQDIQRLEEVHHTGCTLFFNQHEPLLDTAYEINDNTELNDEDRMAQLRYIGEKMGIEFVFVDK